MKKSCVSLEEREKELQKGLDHFMTFFLALIRFLSIKKQPFIG